MVLRNSGRVGSRRFSEEPPSPNGFGGSLFCLFRALKNENIVAISEIMRIFARQFINYLKAIENENKSNDGCFRSGLCIRNECVW